jgi:hypothetical protein
VRWGVIIAVGLVAWGGAPAFAQDAAVAFDHARHAERAAAQGKTLTCAGCHTGGVKASGERPGQQDHAGCDADGCHAADFYAKPAAGDGPQLCLVCHQDNKPWARMTALRDFPAQGRRGKVYCIEFSHAKHLTAERAGDATGDCLACHRRDPEGVEVRPPDHAACATCHDEAGHALPMSACDGCHVDNAQGELGSCRPWIPDYGSRVVKHFNHGTHTVDIRTAGLGPLSCGQCHTQAAKSDAIGEIQLLRGNRTMGESCRGCHDGRTRDPRNNQVVFSTSANCSKCHAKRVVRFNWDSGQPLPPRH